MYDLLIQNWVARLVGNEGMKPYMVMMGFLLKWIIFYWTIIFWREEFVHTIHGNGIFPYMNGRFWWYEFHVGKYTGYRPMDGMGKLNPFEPLHWVAWKKIGGSLTRMFDVLLESLEGLCYKTFHQPNATKKNQNTLEVQDYWIIFMIYQVLRVLRYFHLPPMYSPNCTSPKKTTQITILKVTWKGRVVLLGGWNTATPTPWGPLASPEMCQPGFFPRINPCNGAFKWIQWGYEMILLLEHTNYQIVVMDSTLVTPQWILVVIGWTCYQKDLQMNPMGGHWIFQTCHVIMEWNTLEISTGYDAMCSPFSGKESITSLRSNRGNHMTGWGNHMTGCLEWIWITVVFQQELQCFSDLLSLFVARSNYTTQIYDLYLIIHSTSQTSTQSHLTPRAGFIFGASHQTVYTSSSTLHLLVYTWIDPGIWLFSTTEYANETHALFIVSCAC